MQWNQVYNPLGSMLLSTIAAGLPVVVMLVSLAFLQVAAHKAALATLVVAILSAVVGFDMPRTLALGATGLSLALARCIRCSAPCWGGSAWR